MKETPTNRVPNWWDLRGETAEFVLPMLDRMIEQGNGVPGVLVTENPEYNGSTDVAFDKWQTILSDIHYAMTMIARDNVEEHNQERVQAGCELFGKWFLHLWD